MIKNKLKLSMVAALVTATYGYAGVVKAPNIDLIELSGDIELKQVSEKTTGTNKYRTAEVNLNLDAKADNGLEVFTSFKVHDGNQAGTGAAIPDTASITTTHAYAKIPLGKVKVVAGLAPNFQYGTGAFDNGGESWKMAVFVPVAKGAKLALVSKVNNETGNAGDKGDSGATALRFDAKVGAFKVGVKYGNNYINKDNGFTGVATTTEIEKKVITGYVMGSISGVDVGFEYITADVKKVGAPAQPEDMKGYFLSLNKEFSSSLSAGFAHVNLSKGMKGGEEFAPGIVLDANVNSSATQDTSATVIPVEFKVNEQVTATGTYISADVQGKDASEIDFSLAYGVNDNAEISLGYGKFDGDTGCAIADQTNIEVTIAITF